MWKRQNNPSCSKNVRVFVMLKLDTMQKKKKNTCIHVRTHARMHTCIHAHTHTESPSDETKVFRLLSWTLGKKKKKNTQRLAHTPVKQHGD